MKKRKALQIFIVDDDRDQAESLAEIIATLGHTVTLAYSGDEAVDVYRARDFDLTFMDVRMPGKNGVESFLAIRAMKPDAKVVMMTGFSVEGLLQQAIDNGVVGVLYKPLARNGVITELEKVAPRGIVLIADDDRDFAESVTGIIERSGFSTLLAHDGGEAVQRVIEEHPDVLVLDLRMPVLSGLEVYMELKKRGRALPTVIVTGHLESASAGAVDQLRRYDGAGFLMKPVDPDELTALIGRLAANGRAQ